MKEVIFNRTEHGRHGRKVSLEKLGHKRKTLPVQYTHKLKDRIGDHSDYLKNSK